MIKREIRTASDAVRLLQEVQIEVIETDGGWILHWLAPSEYDYELCCDTAEELIEYACAYQESSACHLADRGTHSLNGFLEQGHGNGALSGWPFPVSTREEGQTLRAGSDTKEVRP